MSNVVLDDAIEMIELCNKILENINELPEKAEDFADSFREKVEFIRDWIIENEMVTDHQHEALLNIEAGVSKLMR